MLEHLYIHNSFRGVIFASITLVGFISYYIIYPNIKDKNEYEKVSGKIEYLNKKYNNLPHRNDGNYRYLIIDNYSYPFEIYKSNSLPQKNNIDDLKIGDTVTVYFYENSYTIEKKLNRFAQFVDKGNKCYYLRDSLMKQIGIVLIGLIFLLNLLCFIFWKKGKLKW